MPVRALCFKSMKHCRRRFQCTVARGMPNEHSFVSPDDARNKIGARLTEPYQGKRPRLRPRTLRDMHSGHVQDGTRTGK